MGDGSGEGERMKLPLQLPFAFFEVGGIGILSIVKISDNGDDPSMKVDT